jgi:hypothetical protein
LQIDDDPNFGSPEVDVTVARTSYTLSGERLKLHGQLSWAAYVRINGTRWDAGTFTPSYFKVGSNPALAVNSQNRVYLASKGARLGIQLTTSSDWSSMTRLSLEDTFNTYGLNLAVDENDVAHASWMEQRPTEHWVPFYTNSSTGWNLVRIPGTSAGGCSEGSMVVGSGQVDLFYESCWDGIDRWTTTDGIEFTRARIPNNDSATSVSAARDAAGNLFVASERDTVPEENLHSSLQTSADGWIPHRFGPGRYPSIAVAPDGEAHALRWGYYADAGADFLYSNSRRGFATWTALPVESSYFEQDILPLVVDQTRDQLHAAFPGEDGIRLCSAAHTRQAADTGTSWRCGPVGKGPASRPDLGIAPDGTLHVAWHDLNGLGYANSLGSFLATNFTPQVSFGAPSHTALAAIVPTAIADADGDELTGQIFVGRYEPVASLVGPGGTAPILQGRYTLGNSSNSFLYDVGGRLAFRAIGGTASWDSYVYRTYLPPLPAKIEIRRPSTNETLGAFIIAAWDDRGVTIVQGDVVPYVRLAYSGTLPDTVDISALPAGETVLGVAVWDGVTSSFGVQPFTKTSGQNQLMLTSVGRR